MVSKLEQMVEVEEEGAEQEQVLSQVVLEIPLLLLQVKETMVAMELLIMYLHIQEVVEEDRVLSERMVLLMVVVLEVLEVLEQQMIL